MNHNSKDRDFLKAHLWKDWEDFKLDQREGLPPPPSQKPYPASAERISLIPVENIQGGDISVKDAIRNRQSRRTYTGGSISMEALSFLLWATQGVRRVIRAGETLKKTVPSAGARHPFETYLLVNNVEGFKTGLYRYLGIEHQLLPHKLDPGLVADVHEGTNNQYVQDSAVVFIWTVIPYRTEWRYGPLSYKMIAQDSGHVCQNLYLACQAFGLGTCAIGAYDQSRLDDILNLDGDDEFTIYVATVGKI